MTNLPSLDALKAQAKSLRNSLGATGLTVTHAQSLELLAKQHGYRDWNTLHAKAGNQTPPVFQLGQRLSGLFRGRPFAGSIISATALANGSHYQVVVRFDDPVNISKFDSMVIERRQVTATLNRHGQTAEKTSDGVPHMQVTL